METSNINSNTYVFCYGSNHPEQLSRRLETTIDSIMSRAISCKVKGFKRVYVGVSRNWGGNSVANIIRDPESYVLGYAVSMTPEEISKLDVFEGYPTWYDRIKVELTSIKKDGSEAVLNGIAYEMIKPEMLT